MIAGRVCRVSRIAARRTVLTAALLEDVFDDRRMAGEALEHPGQADGARLDGRYQQADELVDDQVVAELGGGRGQRRQDIRVGALAPSAPVLQLFSQHAVQAGTQRPKQCATTRHGRSGRRPGAGRGGDDLRDDEPVIRPRSELEVEDDVALQGLGLAQQDVWRAATDLRPRSPAPKAARRAARRRRARTERRLELPGTYCRSPPRTSRGRIDQRRPSSPSSRAKTLRASSRGGHHQSTAPSRPTSAAPCQSPRKPSSAIRCVTPEDAYPRVSDILVIRRRGAARRSVDARRAMRGPKPDGLSVTGAPPGAVGNSAGVRAR